MNEALKGSQKGRRRVDIEIGVLKIGNIIILENQINYPIDQFLYCTWSEVKETSWYQIIEKLIFELFGFSSNIC